MDLPPPFLLAGLRATAVEVATACGRLIVDERPRQVAVAQTKSSATDVVTLMDRRSEQLARALLARRRPDDGVVGEEGADVAGTSGLTWLVDPIDGTVNYLYDIDHYAVCVAAVLGDPRVEGAWYPVAGAVVNPCTGELFSAARGGGARHERAGVVTALSMSPADSLPSSLVGTGFSYVARTRARQGDVLAAVLPRVRDIRRQGVASLDLCDTALGRLDAYYEQGLNPWDMAAAWVVVEEAGGELRGPQGRRPGHALTLAGRGASLDALEELLRELGVTDASADG